MSVLSTIASRQETLHPHAEFLKLRPLIEGHARVVFRGHSELDQEEVVAEAVATAFESYLRLKARGKDPVHDFPWAMARYAVLHVKGDRHVGGQRSSTDVLSRAAQRQHGFRVEALPSTRTSHEKLNALRQGQRQLDLFEERLQDNRQTPVPDQVAFRIDFPAFLKTLCPRDRKLACFLSQGHSGTQAAAKFQLSPGRVTQLRQNWHKEWFLSQGDFSTHHEVTRL